MKMRAKTLQTRKRKLPLIVVKVTLRVHHIGNEITSVWFGEWTKGRFAQYKLHRTESKLTCNYPRMDRISGLDDGYGITHIKW